VKKEFYKATAISNGTPSWFIDATLQWYDLVGTQFELQISDLPDLLGRDLTSPADVISNVAAQLKKMREDLLAAEKEALLKKRQAEVARLERLRKQTPTIIYQGSMQQKKIGTEFMYVSRFVWVDFEKRQLSWSKTESKVDAHKTLDLTKSTVSVDGNVVSIKEEQQAHSVQLKVSWVRTCYVLSGRTACDLLYPCLI